MESANPLVIGLFFWGGGRFPLRAVPFSPLDHVSSTYFMNFLRRIRLVSFSGRNPSTGS